VIHGDHILLDADPLHSRLEIKILARTEVNLGEEKSQVSEWIVGECSGR
jgi:hypothetical protein